MLLIDTLGRFPTIVGLLFLARLIGRQPSPTLTMKIAIALCVSLTGVFITGTPDALAFPDALNSLMLFLAIPNLGLLWWLGQALLKDDFKLSAYAWAGLVIFSLANAVGFLTSHGLTLPSIPAVSVLGGVVSLAVPAHLGWFAVSGWKNDLIEPRRRARIFLVIWMILGLSIILFAEDYILSEEIVSIVRLALTIPIVWFVVLKSTSLQTDPLLFINTQPEITPKNIKTDRKHYINATHQRLIIAIVERKVYLEPSLTIAALAKECGAAEYQLRKLINQELGYRNFSAFLNSYRIAHAKELLSASGDKALPITNIAFDCGFTTISTFNRAFKSLVGQSPSEYRATAGKVSAKQ